MDTKPEIGDTILIDRRFKTFLTKEVVYKLKTRQAYAGVQRTVTVPFVECTRMVLTEKYRPELILYSIH